MKLREDFIAHNSDNDYMLIPLGGASFSGLVRGNKTFGAIVECLKEETSEEEIVEALSSRFNAPSEVISRDVSVALAKLREIGALDG